MLKFNPLYLIAAVLFSALIGGTLTSCQEQPAVTYADQEFDAIRRQALAEYRPNPQACDPLTAYEQSEESRARQAVCHSEKLAGGAK